MATVSTHLQRGSTAGQALRFLLVGGSSYVLNMSTYSLFVHVGLLYLLAAVCSYVIGFAFNFLANRHWTFGAADGDLKTQIARFSVTAVFVLVADLVLLWIAVDGLGMHEIVAQGVVILLLAPSSFLLNRLWSFRGHGVTAPGAA